MQIDQSKPLEVDDDFDGGDDCPGEFERQTNTSPAQEPEVLNLFSSESPKYSRDQKMWRDQSELKKSKKLIRRHY